MELEGRDIQRPSRRSLTMQRNKVHHVYTVAHVAKTLGVDEELIRNVTVGLEPEDGVVRV